MDSGARPIGFLAVLAVAVALAGCGTYAQQAGDRGCARAVLDDWADGSIDRMYPEPCYLAAIDALPEDLRAYTSAHDDIKRALQSHRRLDDATGKGTRTLAEVPAAESTGVPVTERPPLEALILAALGGFACAAGLAAFVVRRLRRSPS